MNRYETEEQIYKYLRANNLFPDEVAVNELMDIEVQIDWGDWKHEHLRCDYLMKQIGFTCTGMMVTEEDGSDTYSARHYYMGMYKEVGA